MEGSWEGNIASGPILGHLSSVNQTGGVEEEGGDWGVSDRVREVGEKGGVASVEYCNEGQQTGLRSMSWEQCQQFAID